MSKNNKLKNLSKSVTVIGLGQIGLPTAVLGALKGYKVYGVDIDQNRLEKIKNLDENGIEAAVLFFLQDEDVINNLNLSTSVCIKTDYYLICVPTYFNENKILVLEHVYDCCRSIIPFLTKGSVVIIESTVPVGCSRKIAEFLEKESALKLEVDLFVACSPERLMPGQAFKELVFCDRVIGGMGQASSQLAVDFYSPLIKGSLFQTSLETAELVKITENSHRAVQIAFANQMSNLAKSVGVDPFELVRLANKHPRVNVAMPGIGIGGDCVPVHPLFLKEEPVGYLPSIVEQALEINRYQEELVVADILNMADRLKQKRRKLKVLILGLTYKPNVADIRNSPAIRISQTLSSTDKFTLKVFDPYLEDAQFEKLGLSSIACLSEHKNMDLIIFLVGHDKFAQLKELNLSADKYYDPIGFFQKTKDAILEKESTVN